MNFADSVHDNVTRRSKNNVANLESMKIGPKNKVLLIHDSSK